MRVEIEPLRDNEVRCAAELLSHAFKTNPIHVAAFGSDERRTQVYARRLFQSMLSGLQRRGAVFGAYADGRLLGVGALAAPGRCQPGLGERARLGFGLLSVRQPTIPLRASVWARAWAAQDPRAPHWHVGPIGVDVDQQGHGVGTALVQTLCGIIDDGAGLGYLETDRRENIAFYERSGFDVCAAKDVLGVTTWYMTRQVKVMTKAGA